MSNLTNELPDNIDEILARLRLYVDKTYLQNDKEQVKNLLANCKLSIIKTGQWGSRWGYAEAKGILAIPVSNFDEATKQMAFKIAGLLDTVMQGTDCGLEITSVEFVPGNTPKPDVTRELNQLLSENKHLSDNLAIPSDLLDKGKMMSEIYLYIYFVENCIRLFIENVSQTNTVTYPREVLNTITKNKTNEQQNKFLPLRGNSDLYYCDFVQLQQIILHNWELFKANFPQQDQHWLRVKIEDMYRVRNLIAHCGYVTKDEFEMIKSNFKMILRQLKFMS